MGETQEWRWLDFPGLRKESMSNESHGGLASVGNFLYGNANN